MSDSNAKNVDELLAIDRVEKELHEFVVNQWTSAKFEEYKNGIFGAFMK